MLHYPIQVIHHSAGLQVGTADTEAGILQGNPVVAYRKRGFPHVDGQGKLRNVYFQAVEADNTFGYPH